MVHQKYEMQRRATICNNMQQYATNFAQTVDKILFVAYNKCTQQMQHERLEAIRWMTRRKWP